MPQKWHFRLKASKQPTQITSLSNRAATRICWTTQPVWAETAMLLAAGRTHLSPLWSGSETEVPLAEHCVTVPKFISSCRGTIIEMAMAEWRWEDIWLACWQGWFTRLPSRFPVCPKFYNPRLEEVHLAPQHAQCGQNISQKNSITNLCNGNEPPISSKILSEVSQQRPKLWWDHLLRAVYADYKRTMWKWSFFVSPVSQETISVAHISDPHPRGNVHFQHGLAPPRANAPQGLRTVTVLPPLRGEQSAAAIQTPELNHSHTKPSWMSICCSKCGQKGIVNCSYSASWYGSSSTSKCQSLTDLAKSDLAGKKENSSVMSSHSD